MSLEKCIFGFIVLVIFWIFADLILFTKKYWTKGRCQEHGVCKNFQCREFENCPKSIIYD